jgi:hypothetical protein
MGDRPCSQEGDMAITRILLVGTLLTLIGTVFPALAATKHHQRWAVEADRTSPADGRTRR